MNRFRFSLALLFFVLIGQGEAGAQFLPPPPTVFVTGNGINFLYARKNVVVTGSLGARVYSVGNGGLPFPGAPYGIQQNRITIQYLTPQPIVVGGYRGDPTEGIDLDALPPKKTLPLREEPPAAPMPPPRIEAKPREPEAEFAPFPPGVEVSKPKPVLRPDDPMPEPKPRSTDPKVEGAGGDRDRMMQDGQVAFREGSYGLAVLRFLQAAESNPADFRARFLLAQAQFALGKYREAVSAIEDGLKLDKNWPAADFKPRVELYRGNEGEFDAQLKRLQGVCEQNPRDAGFGFLLAYQYWFDGRRPEAVMLFHRVRPFAGDHSGIDAFLAAAGPAVAMR